MRSTRKTFACGLILCVYWIALFHPFYALLEYTINKQYISQTLCENRNTPQLHCEGKCYLAKRVVQAVEVQSEKSKPAHARHNLEETLYLCQLHAVKLYLQEAIKLTLEAKHTRLLSAFHTDIFHPPRHRRILL